MSGVSGEFRRAVVALIHSDAVAGTGRHLVQAAHAAGLKARKHGDAIEIADQRDMVILRQAPFGAGWMTCYWGRARAG